LVVIFAAFVAVVVIFGGGGGDVMMDAGIRDLATLLVLAARVSDDEANVKDPTLLK
jgi:hypothetical protein